VYKTIIILDYQTVSSERIHIILKENTPITDISAYTDFKTLLEQDKTVRAVIT